MGQPLLPALNALGGGLTLRNWLDSLTFCHHWITYYVTKGLSR